LNTFYLLTKNGAAGIFFGPSYFDPALVVH
jgi:hypothetical protein